ncbi:hypothetical protein LCGC14_2717410, partial [marine sediment metagenome]
MDFDKLKNTIICGKNEDVMPTIATDSIDCVITDPPYGWSFMGKGWDYKVPSVAQFAEILRVLKPGGTMLCFAGSRTQHRMAVNVEDAGFILKDCIMWLYGSGFPKATDISKQIDKQDAVKKRRQRQLRFTEWMRGTGLSASQCGIIMGTESEAGHYFTSGEQPHIATKQYFDKLRPYIKCDVPEWVEQMIAERTVESENFKKREVVGRQENAMSGWSMDGETKFEDRDITAPATPEALLWNGWKSHGLKPAYEPILVAMKCNDGSYANNALVHGVSGLNIDAGRIPAKDGVPKFTKRREDSQSCYADGLGGSNRTGEIDTETGRFPANVILDEQAAAMLDEQSGESVSTDRVRENQLDNHKFFTEGEHKKGVDSFGFNDKGGASRFFYCAKASKSERNEGCEGLEVKQKYAKNGQGGS